MDKRIVKTKRAILISILEQTQNKDLKDVRVVKLCDDAGINKSTFYLHYKSLDECCISLINDISKFINSIASSVNFDSNVVDANVITAKVVKMITENYDIIAKYRVSRISLSLTPKLVDETINTIAVNNKIMSNTKEYADLCLLIYAMTGMILDSNFIANQHTFTRALTEMIRAK